MTTILFDIHSIKRYWKDMENGHLLPVVCNDDVLNDNCK